MLNKPPHKETGVRLKGKNINRCMPLTLNGLFFIDQLGATVRCVGCRWSRVVHVPRGLFKCIEKRKRSNVIENNTNNRMSLCELLQGLVWGESVCLCGCFLGRLGRRDDAAG